MQRATSSNWLVQLHLLTTKYSSNNARNNKRYTLILNILKRFNWLIQLEVTKTTITFRTLKQILFVEHVLLT